MGAKGAKDEGKRRGKLRALAWLGGIAGAIVAAGGLFGALDDIGGFVGSVYNHYKAWQEGRPETDYKRLAKLNVDVQMKVFHDAIGMDPQTCHGAKEGGRECTYVKPHVLVKVFTDRGGEVEAFVVTTRSPDFNPAFHQTTNGITLGKTTPAEALEAPDQVSGYSDMTSSEYAETSGSTHSSLCRSYLVGVSGAGYVDDASSKALMLVGRPLEDAMDKQLGSTMAGAEGDFTRPWPEKDVPWLSQDTTVGLLQNKRVLTFRKTVGSTPLV